MGHTTSISDYELERGDGPPPCEGYDVEAEYVKAKVVEPEDKPAPKKTTARSK